MRDEGSYWRIKRARWAVFLGKLCTREGTRSHECVLLTSRVPRFKSDASVATDTARSPFLFVDRIGETDVSNLLEHCHEKLPRSHLRSEAVAQRERFVVIADELREAAGQSGDSSEEQDGDL